MVRLTDSEAVSDSRQANTRMAKSQAPAGEATDAAPVGGNDQTVEFHYIKSPQFRVIHVDGAIGGSAPRGKLFVNIFSERIPIPRRQVFRLNADATLGPELPEQ